MPPASEIATPPEVELLREALTMQCDDTTCLVHARYVLASPRDHGFTFWFALPGRVESTVTLDGQPLRPKVVAEPHRSELEQAYYLFPRDGSPPVQRVYVWTPMGAGEHVLEVRYVQRLATREVNWGTNHDGKMVSYAKRLLAPLQGSKLAADFVLTLDVSYDRGNVTPPGQRRFGEVKSLGCSDSAGRFAATSSGHERVARVTLHVQRAELSGEITCRIGPRMYVDPAEDSFVGL